MLLASTSDVLRVVTTAAVTPGRTNTAIVAALPTTGVAGGAGGAGAVCIFTW